MSFIYAILIT